MAALLARWVHMRMDGSPDMLPELAADIEHRMQENGIVAQTSYRWLAGWLERVSEGLRLALEPSWSLLRHVSEPMGAVGEGPKEPDRRE